MGDVPGTVLIVDDHAASAQAAHGAWSATAGRSSARPPTAPAALAEAERCNPDVVLLDVGLPDISGIEVARQLASALPGGRRRDDLDPGRGDFGDLALASGARGFLSKAGSLRAAPSRHSLESGSVRSMAVRIEQTVARASACRGRRATPRPGRWRRSPIDLGLAAWPPPGSRMPADERLRCAASPSGAGRATADGVRRGHPRRRRCAPGEGLPGARLAVGAARRGSPTSPPTTASPAARPPRPPGCTPRSRSRCAASAASSASIEGFADEPREPDHELLATLEVRRRSARPADRAPPRRGARRSPSSGATARRSRPRWTA